MTNSSASLRSRNSDTVPTFQPFASSFLRFSGSIAFSPSGYLVVARQALLTKCNRFLGRLLCFLLMPVDDHNGVRINAIEESPCDTIRLIRSEEHTSELQSR